MLLMLNILIIESTLERRTIWKLLLMGLVNEQARDDGNLMVDIRCSVSSLSQTLFCSRFDKSCLRCTSYWVIKLSEPKTKTRLRESIWDNPTDITFPLWILRLICRTVNSPQIPIRAWATTNVIFNDQNINYWVLWFEASCRTTQCYHTSGVELKNSETLFHLIEVSESFSIKEKRAINLHNIVLIKKYVNTFFNNMGQTGWWFLDW